MGSKSSNNSEININMNTNSRASIIIIEVLISSKETQLLDSLIQRF